ncbi:hypothetical protein R3751_15525 [Halorubrum distributum]|uniref:hypothetical protein n=1 Tax=Halorubrum distributum TaxID=29283 RepID=UPI002953C18D|nr:hypothetical protein [Halorubrum distributum]MDV7351182.1 hypothetical protein [Halorubrum distributum]
MTFLHHRRHFLAAVGSLSTAGCLVQRDTAATDVSEDPPRSDTTGSTHSQTSTSNESNSMDSTHTDNGPTDTTTSLDTVGIAVEEIRIDRIIESPYQSQIVAEIVISNVGPAQYGTLEFRADAYYEPPADDRTYHPPRVSTRTAVGRTYIERQYDSFDSGTRTLRGIVIQYDADDANGSTDPARFDIELAVRRVNRLGA